MSLRNEAKKGFLWVSMERFGQQLMQGIVFVILARLLSPEDFGLVALLMIFLVISRSFIDSGMGQALIREKEISDIDRSTVFWLNLLLSILFYCLLFFSAPYIATFFDSPKLVNLTRVMGLGIIFIGVSIVQRAELTQRLNFKKQTYAQLPAVLIAGIVSVSMAYFGYGVWSLVTQYIVVSLCSSMFLWILEPAKIKLQWSKESFFRLFGFGYKLLISGLIDTIYQNIYKIVIGKYFATATLGFYAQAKRIQELTGQNLAQVTQQVTYPLLSQAGNDQPRLKRGYRQIIQFCSFVIFPGMLLLIILAEPILINILGEKWAPAAPFLQVICLSGILYHLHSINLNVLKVMGRSDLFLRLEIIKKFNISIAILVGLQFGIFGLLIGQVISSYLALIINAFYTSKFLNYSLVEQGKDVIGILFLSLPMALVVGLLHFFVPIKSLPTLVLFVGVAFFIYLVTNLIFKTEITKIITSVILPYLPEKIKNKFSIA